jgi:hypothetical protein
LAAGGDVERLPTATVTAPIASLIALVVETVKAVPFGADAALMNTSPLVMVS